VRPLADLIQIKQHIRPLLGCTQNSRLSGGIIETVADKQIDRRYINQSQCRRAIKMKRSTGRHTTPGRTVQHPNDSSAMNRVKRKRAPGIDPTSKLPRSEGSAENVQAANITGRHQ